MFDGNAAMVPHRDIMLEALMLEHWTYVGSILSNGHLSTEWPEDQQC